MGLCHPGEKQYRHRRRGSIEDGVILEVINK